MPVKNNYHNETIEVIRDDMLRAKDRGQKIPYYLSGGRHKDRQAISAIRNAGRFAIITSVALMAIVIIALIVLFVNFTAGAKASAVGFSSGAFLTYALILVLPIVELILGIKLFDLNVTPREAKTYLLVIMLLNILPFATGFPGILGILTIIFVINAFIKMPIYEQWFESRFRAMWKLRPGAKTPLNKGSKKAKKEEDSAEEDADEYYDDTL